MAYKNKILFGRITKIQGNSGAVSVSLEKTFIENIPEMESVFIEIEGKPVPFFLSGKEYSGGTSIKLNFESYRTFEKISEFKGCNIFLTSPPDGYKDIKDTESFIGYTILSYGNKFIGTVTGIINNSGQELLVILSDIKKEILIPLHDDLIINLDRNNKIIVVDIPEGLTDIN